MTDSVLPTLQDITADLNALRADVQALNSKLEKADPNYVPPEDLVVCRRNVTWKSFLWNDYCEVEYFPLFQNDYEIVKKGAKN